MRIGQYIYSKLSGTTAVTDLVSTRIYPVFLPQNASLPAIVFSMENRPLDKQKDRVAYHDFQTVTFTYWADAAQGANAYAALDNIDSAVRTAIDFVAATSGSVTVETCEYVSSADGMDDDTTRLARTAVFTFVTKNT